MTIHFVNLTFGLSAKDRTANRKFSPKAASPLSAQKRKLNECQVLADTQTL